MYYVIEAYVTMNGSKIEKTFVSKHYRGARWKAVRWINKTKDGLSLWGWSVIS